MKELLRDLTACNSADPLPAATARAHRRRARCDQAFQMRPCRLAVPRPPSPSPAAAPSKSAKTPRRPSVVPRQLEFHRNTNIINSLQKSGVQVGQEQPIRRCRLQQNARYTKSALSSDLHKCALAAHPPTRAISVILVASRQQPDVYPTPSSIAKPPPAHALRLFHLCYSTLIASTRALRIPNLPTHHPSSHQAQTQTITTYIKNQQPTPLIPLYTISTPTPTHPLYHFSPSFLQLYHPTNHPTYIPSIQLNTQPHSPLPTSHHLPSPLHTPKLFSTTTLPPPSLHPSFKTNPIFSTKYARLHNGLHPALANPTKRPSWF